MCFWHNTTACVSCSTALLKWSLWSLGKNPQGSKNNAANLNVDFRRPHQQPPFSLILFIHGFILRTVGFIVHVGSPLRPLRAMVKRGKSWPNELLLVADCAFLCHRTLQRPSLSRLGSLCSSWDQQLLLLTQGWGPVGRPPCAPVGAAP